MVFYGILDLMSAPVFLFGYIALVSSVDEAVLRTTAFGSAARGENVEQQPAPTKAAPGQPQQTSGNAGQNA